ncbi:MAG: hypothetical protein NT075_32290 [Chloroflexi bacterium]|nr:hypothetical protein [Chloroflexota bacterium]
MANVIFQAHSGWRYLVLLVAILAVLKFLIGWLTTSKWSGLDRGLGTAFPIVLDIQLLLGLVLYVMAPGYRFLARPISFGEHFGTMVLAVIVAHITWSRVKKSTPDTAKFRIGTIGFVIAGLLVGLGVLRITGML